MRKKHDEPHIKYFDMGMFPLYFGFTTNPTAFKKEMNRIGVSGPNIGKGPDFARHGAGATTWVFKKDGATTIIVCLVDRPDLPPYEKAALVAHEAVHVWEAVLEHIETKNPGGELQAYAIQFFTRNMLREMGCSLSSATSTVAKALRG